MLTATEQIFSDEVLKRGLIPRRGVSVVWYNGFGSAEVKATSVPAVINESRRLELDKQALLIEVKDYLKSRNWYDADQLVTRMERLGLGR